MAALDRPGAGPLLKSLDVFDLERGSPSPDADGAVYPVWFGTNRKPKAHRVVTAPWHSTLGQQCNDLLTMIQAARY